MADLRQRRSIRELEKEYHAGNRKPLETLIRAWKGIQELDPTDQNSFFIIGGYHGEPFRGAGWGNDQWWGGYCNHGNILFPTWHRAYLLRLEDALRSIHGCEDVALAYWDETDEETREKGVPAIFLSPWFELDGQKIKNPLHSYTFGAGVWDNIPLDDGANPADYSKPPGYTTVRYPYSGLVSGKQAEHTKIHNEKMDAMGEEKTNELLNQNVQNWLDYQIILHEKDKPVLTGTRKKFEKCLQAPNYTVFSNTTSATQWNEDNFGILGGEWSEKDATEAVVPVESPHNDIHLAVGGFGVPGSLKAGDFDHVPDANGDMGENDTAGFDPIFYFHHCFIDRVFWNWQVLKDSTDTLEIIPEYPGTNSTDAQGPTPGVPGNAWLTMDSPLAPFKKVDTHAKATRTMSSRDVVNIEKQLGYTYHPTIHKPLTAIPPSNEKNLHVRVSGINRNAVPGSFVVATYLPDPEDDSKRQYLGYETVLSRWHTSGCANCQTHQQMKTFIPLPGVSAEDAKKVQAEVIPRTVASNLFQGPKGIKPRTQTGKIGVKR